MNAIRPLLVAFTTITILTGCMERHSDPTAEGHPGAVFRPSIERDVSATEYRLAPPDKIAIRAPGIKELDQTITQIRPDGKISLNLIGEFYIAGKTPIEAADAMSKLAAKYYNGVAVQVDVVEYNSKFYTVFGTAVRSAGKKPYTGRNTVIMALAEAGFTDDAWPQQVSLSRPGADGQSHSTAIIDLKTMYLYGDTRQNYLLNEGDVIYVPDSPLKAWEKTARKTLGPFTGIQSAANSVAPTPKQ